jgi:hypothetical protein
LTSHDLAQKPALDFSSALTTAARLPGVRIDRDTYLRKALARYCPQEQVTVAVQTSPADAGVSLDILRRAADDSIRYESARVTALAAAAGIPGGFALIGALPADIAQTIAHILRIAQKLAYLYSWPELFGEDGDAADDATAGMLTLFAGVMFGVQAANEGVARIAVLVSKELLRSLPQRALTQGVVYPIVKSVAKYLGVQMTKQVFAKGVAKIVPVVGAVVSGGITLATFVPLCHRLKKHLSSSVLAVRRTEKDT